MHGVAIRPGHPVVPGLGPRRAVVGIPDTPCQPRWRWNSSSRRSSTPDSDAGRRRRPTLTAVVPRTVVSPMGDDEFVRVKVRPRRLPHDRGSARARGRSDHVDGARGRDHPHSKDVRGAGGWIFRRSGGAHRSRAVVHTAVLIGSHDPALDVLANEVHRRFAPATVASTNVGSQGGLAGAAPEQRACGRMPPNRSGHRHLQRCGCPAHPARPRCPPRDVCAPSAGPHGRSGEPARRSLVRGPIA